ncbi:MAG: hypothetical protein Q8R57_05880 [Bacteroidota bacterium]|nr:hypothetical protein [Bacteroidota bacterium]
MEDLQQLFFFHPNQKKYRKQIVLAIEKYGKPEIKMEENRVSIWLANLAINQQSIMVFDKLNPHKILAVLIYVKEGQLIKIIHIAIQSDLNEIYHEGDVAVLTEIMTMFKAMVSKMKEVTLIQFEYSKLQIAIN